MKGVFSYGDILEIEPCKLKELFPGNIIAFKDIREKGKNDQMAHRIIKIKKNCLITKGDNNKYPDFYPVTQKNLIGRTISFERKGKPHKVRGGLTGLYFARTKYYFRRCLFWVYTNICKSSIVKTTGRLLLKKIYKNINKIKLSSPEGPITKWILKNRVIGQKGPDKDYFYIKKPFDLIIKK